jgi:hypothetical protein
MRNCSATINEKVEQQQKKYLVRWEGFPDSEATWEVAAELKDTEVLDFGGQEGQERQGGKQGEGECKDLVLASCPYIPSSLFIRLGGRWTRVVLRWWEAGARRRGRASGRLEVLGTEPRGFR